jgi:serpin B
VAGALGALESGLASRAGEVELRAANAVWVDAAPRLEPPLVRAVESAYGAGLHTADFVHEAEAARGTINAWVGEVTRSRIPELIPAGILNDLTRLVLTNALYLKAAWSTQFNEAATSELPFHRLDGSTVDVPTMRTSTRLDHATGEGWQAVRLPYVGDGLSMFVLVPDPGAFDRIESHLSPALLDDVAGSLRSDQVALSLPRFELRTALSLVDSLQALGMVSAFDDDTADFSAMSPDPLCIGDVLHEVFVAVDEHGTEAAAATAVIMREAMARPQQPVEITVDRPFLFAVVDEPSRTPLFLGRVVDPS